MINIKRMITEIECKATNGETYLIPIREVLKKYNKYIVECLEEQKEIDSFEVFVNSGRIVAD